MTFSVPPLFNVPLNWKTCKNALIKQQKILSNKKQQQKQNYRKIPSSYSLCDSAENSNFKPQPKIPELGAASYAWGESTQTTNKTKIVQKNVPFSKTIEKKPRTDAHRCSCGSQAIPNALRCADCSLGRQSFKINLHETGQSPAAVLLP